MTSPASDSHASLELEVGERTVRISNPDRVYWRIDLDPVPA